MLSFFLNDEVMCARTPLPWRRSPLRLDPNGNCKCDIKYGFKMKEEDKGQWRGDQACQDERVTWNRLKDPKTVPNLQNSTSYHYIKHIKSIWRRKKEDSNDFEGVKKVCTMTPLSPKTCPRSYDDAALQTHSNFISVNSIMFGNIIKVK